MAGRRHPPHYSDLFVYFAKGRLQQRYDESQLWAPPSPTIGRKITATLWQRRKDRAFCQCGQRHESGYRNLCNDQSEVIGTERAGTHQRVCLRLTVSDLSARAAETPEEMERLLDGWKTATSPWTAGNSCRRISFPSGKLWFFLSMDEPTFRWISLHRARRRFIRQAIEWMANLCRFHHHAYQPDTDQRTE